MFLLSYLTGLVKVSNKSVLAKFLKMMEMVGMHVLSTATFTRPANTTAYTVGDTVGTTPGAALEFTNVAFAQGLTGLVVSAKIGKQTVTVTNAVFRLYLFTSAPTVTDDNVAANILWAEMPNLCAVVDFYLLQAETVGSSQAIIESIAIPFKCSSTSKSLYGMLVAEGAYVPASAEQFTITLGIERD